MRNFLILTATLFAVSVVSAFADDKCQLKRFGAAIPFETDEDGQIYVPATLGGRSKSQLLDTGADWSKITEDLAKSLNLTASTIDSSGVQMRDLAGKKIDKVVMVPEVKIGSLSYDGAVPFFVGGALPGRTIEQGGGLYGQNMLTRVDLEIDNAGKTISLFSQDHCSGDGVYWTDEAVTLQYKRVPAVQPPGTRIRQRIDKDQIDPPIVGAELQGESVSVLFDTGAASSSMDLELAQRRFGIGPGSPGVQPAGKVYTASGEEVETYSYTFKSLTISGIGFTNVPVLLGKFAESAQIILGMNELKHLHIYFSFREGFIYVTGADAGRPQK